ncbi:hypothetical protein F7725_003809, partial [Dissostichus mawsoni]
HEAVCQVTSIRKVQPHDPAVRLHNGRVDGKEPRASKTALLVKFSDAMSSSPYSKMPKVKRSRKPPPDGWELIEPTLDELDQKMREAETEPHEGKRKVESLWPIFRLHHQRSRYIYDLFYKRKAISRELYEYCIKEGYADKNLIAKWKKQGYENLCCLRCIQTRDTNFGTNCICRVPKSKLEVVVLRDELAEVEQDLAVLVPQTQLFLQEAAAPALHPLRPLGAADGEVQVVGEGQQEGLGCHLTQRALQVEEEGGAAADGGAMVGDVGEQLASVRRTAQRFLVDVQDGDVAAVARQRAKYWITLKPTIVTKMSEMENNLKDGFEAGGLRVE